MNYSLQDDLGLLTLLKQGDVAAFTELYNRYREPLYFSARNVLRQPDVAKDIVQEVFTTLWQNKANLEIRHPKAWLHQAVRFQVLKAIRSDRTDADFYQRLSRVSNDIIVENPLLFKELRQIIDGLIEILPEDCRRAFSLSREQDLTYPQIAEELNISVKTVEKKMSRSLRSLRIGLKKATISLLFFFLFLHS
jgi:RNA polymerase sigma-70 factor (ECF subfamily)